MQRLRRVLTKKQRRSPRLPRAKLSIPPMILIVPSYRTAQQARAGFVRQTERDGATTKCGTITFEYLPLRRSIIRVKIAWTTFPTSEIAVRQVAVSRSPNNPVSLGAFLHLALPPLSITRQRLEPHSIDRCDRAHPPALTRCPPAPCGGHDRAPVTLQMHAVLDGAPRLSALPSSLLSRRFRSISGRSRRSAPICSIRSKA